MLFHIVILGLLAVGEANFVPVPQGQAPPAAATVNRQQDSALVEIRHSVDLLEQRLNSLDSQMSRFGTLLAIILGAAAIGSLFSLFRNEWHAWKGFSLASAGERAAQNRAAEVHESFLKGSKETLELVNQTLTLAKDASDRAARSQETMANELLDKLDAEAKNLCRAIRSVDDRTLARDASRLADLRSLAQRLDSFESSRQLLFRSIKLPPHCLFVRGMHFHVNQQFRDALDAWKELINNVTADRRLACLAWYWTGYEHNNLAQFQDAGAAFDAALGLAEGADKFELRRMGLEAKYFAADLDEAPDTVVALKQLLAEMVAAPDAKELRQRIDKTNVLVGNILHVLGVRAVAVPEADTAKTHFREAAQHFQAAQEREQYARFGLAETYHQLGETDEALKLYRDSVRADAISEARRPEPRTQVLALTTQLISCIRVPEWRNELAAIRQAVEGALRDVDQRLTVYSQLQRRNIPKDRFPADLEALQAGIAEVT